MQIKNKIIREIAVIVITIIVLLIPIVVCKYIHPDSYDSVLVLNTILFFDIMFVHQRVREWLKQKTGRWMLPASGWKRLASAKVIRRLSKTS